MGQNKFNGMTASERVTYSQGRTTSDMSYLREQISEMYRRAIFDRNLLIVLAFLFSIIILLAFNFMNPASTLEFILLAVIAAVFVAGGLVAERSVRHRIEMMDALKFLYSRLAEDESVKFGFETMQAQSEEAREVSIAWHMIDQLVARIQKGNGGKKNGKPDAG